MEHQMLNSIKDTMFRHAFNKVKCHGKRILGHAVTLAGHTDRGLGHTAHYYKHLAPVVIPLAREHGYGDLADQIHHNATTIFRAREHGHAVGNALRKARA